MLPPDGSPALCAEVPLHHARAVDAVGQLLRLDVESARPATRPVLLEDPLHFFSHGLPIFGTTVAAGQELPDHLKGVLLLAGHEPCRNAQVEDLQLWVNIFTDLLPLSQGEGHVSRARTVSPPLAQRRPKPPGREHTVIPKEDDDRVLIRALDLAVNRLSMVPR